MDRRTSQSTVHGVANSWTWLNNLATIIIYQWDDLLAFGVKVECAKAWYISVHLWKGTLPDSPSDTHPVGIALGVLPCPHLASHPSEGFSHGFPHLSKLPASTPGKGTLPLLYLWDLSSQQWGWSIPLPFWTPCNWCPILEMRQRPGEAMKGDVTWTVTLAVWYSRRNLALLGAGREALFLYLQIKRLQLERWDCSLQRDFGE